MSNEARDWLRRAKRLSESVPEGMEAVFDGGSITLYPTGTLDAHVQAQTNSGIDFDQEDFGSVILSSRSRIIPYPEGTYNSI